MGRIREKAPKWGSQQPDLLGSMGIIPSRQQALLTQDRLPRGEGRLEGGPGVAMINGLSATEERNTPTAPGQPETHFGTLENALNPSLNPKKGGCCFRGFIFSSPHPGSFRNLVRKDSLQNLL